MADPEYYRFDSEDADHILRREPTDSGDSPREFRVHKCILSVASPVFADLFAHAQPGSESPTNPNLNTNTNSLPIVPVFNDSDHDLELILRFIYPVPDPVITTLDTLVSALRIADKYHITSATSTLRKWLLDPVHLKSDPVRVYAIACLYGFWDEARVASKHSLKVDILDNLVECKELVGISGRDYHLLLALHRDRAKAAMHIFHWDWTPSNPVVVCDKCTPHPDEGTLEWGIMEDAYRPAWWWRLEPIAKAELNRRPTTDVIFRTNFLLDNYVGGSDCTKCPTFQDSGELLREIERRIDGLPDMVSFN